MQNKSAYIWGLFSRFAPSGIQLLTNMFLARLLSPQDFGTIGVLAVVYSVANTLVDAGLGGSLVKEDNLNKIDYSTISTFNILVSVLIYLVLYWSAPSLETYFNIAGISRIIRILSLTIIIGSFAVVSNAILTKLCKFNDIFKVSITSIIIASIIAIVAARFGCGVYSLVFYQLTYSIVKTILSNIFAKYKLSFGFSIESMKKLLPFGVFTSLITAIDTIFENILTTLTGKYLSVQQAGYVSQSKRLDDALGYSIAMTIGTVTFPILTRLKADIVAFKNEAKSIYKTVILLLTPVLMVVAVFSGEVMVLLFGKQWIGAAVYLKGFMFAGLFLVLEALLYGFIKSLGDVSKLTIITILKRMIGISIIILTLKYYPQRIVLGYVVSTSIGFFANLFLYCKITSTRILRLILRTSFYIIPSVLLFLLMSCVKTFAMQLYVVIIIAFLFALIYYLFVLRLYGINLLKYLKSYLYGST